MRSEYLLHLKAIKKICHLESRARGIDARILLIYIDPELAKQDS